MEKLLKYYPKLIAGYFLLCLNFCCTEVHKKDFNSLSKVEKDSLAELHDELSDYFLQPSKIHRIYKDSALYFQPENVDIRQRLSYSYKKTGEHIKAMELLNKAVEIDISNDNADALQYRAWTLLYYYRDYEGTILDVDLIEKMTGNSYNSCWGEPCGFLKGQALYKMGRYEEAITTFINVNIEEEKLGFDITDNHLLFFYIGRCLSEMKKHKEAINFYEKTLLSVEKFPESYYQIGLSYKALNNMSLAKKNFNLARNYLKYSMDEPFIERFDEVFSYMIENELKIFN
jgi:tetratricopeptide (TPR) repeat protein